MATVSPPLPHAFPAVADDLRDDRHGWGFALLLLIVGTLFLRPADLFPALVDWPIYQMLIAACLIVAARPALRQVSLGPLSRQPVTGCLMLLLIAIALSHLSHGFVWAARMSTWMAIKLVVFYLLVTALIDSPGRLFVFARWLAFVITIMATLAVLDHYEVLPIDAIEAVQDRYRTEQSLEGQVDRIRGTGIFQDPNDFGLVIVTGLVFTSFFLMTPNTGWPRYFWLIPMAVLLVALGLTHSRGALLSLITVLGAGLLYRRSWLAVAFGSLGLLPIIMYVFSGRMTELHSVHEGTGQTRLQIWSDSLAIWRSYPWFGLGEGLLVEQTGVVTHNSFLHCFSELGFLGGAAFVGAFLAASLGLWTRQTVATADDVSLARLRAYTFAAILGYAAGITLISRQFVTPTYLMLGLATTVQTLSEPAERRLRMNNRFIILTLLASIAALALYHVCVRLLVRW